MNPRKSPRSVRAAGQGVRGHAPPRRTNTGPLLTTTAEPAANTAITRWSTVPTGAVETVSRKARVVDEIPESERGDGT